MCLVRIGKERGGSNDLKSKWVGEVDDLVCGEVSYLMKSMC